MSDEESFRALCDNARTDSEIECVPLFGNPLLVNPVETRCVVCAALKNNDFLQNAKAEVTDMKKDLGYKSNRRLTLQQQCEKTPDEARYFVKEIDELALDISTTLVVIESTESEIEGMSGRIIAEKEGVIIQEARDIFERINSGKFYYGPVSEEEISAVGLDMVPTERHLSAKPTIITHQWRR